MNPKKAYIDSVNKYCMLETFFRLTKVLILFFFFLIFPFFCIGQEEPQYDEVTVYLKVSGVGGSEIPALVKDGKAYLSISDVFNVLKIKNTPSAHLDSYPVFLSRHRMNI